MHRRDLLDKLARFRTTERHEQASREQMIAFVRRHPDCFERSLAIGHVTGSAWILSADGSRALLSHHRKLNKWLQLGGHADGDADVLRVALREAQEESGLTGIEPVSAEIFDVDVHAIPPRGGDSAHLHYDVRFLFRATGGERFRVSDESHDLAWVTPRELTALDVDESVLRMHRKWLALPVGV